MFTLLTHIQKVKDFLVHIFILKSYNLKKWSDFDLLMETWKFYLLLIIIIWGILTNKVLVLILKNKNTLIINKRILSWSIIIQFWKIIVKNYNKNNKNNQMVLTLSIVCSMKTKYTAGSGFVFALFFLFFLFMYSLKIVKCQILRPTVVMFFKYLISCDWLSDFYHLWFGIEPVPYDNSILYGTLIQQTELLKIFAERHNGFSEEDSHSHGLCRARTRGEALPNHYRLVILFI